MSGRIAVWLTSLAAGLSPAIVFSQPSKLAVVVAVGSYPASSGYSKINSANDVPLVTAALEAQGFAPGDITVLRDADATRARIIRALEQMGQRARKGDALVFHYSGHGHRVTDDNGDELDGLDEILVPYDAFIPTDEFDTRAPYFLRDDDLGRILSGLRRRVGPNGSVTVFLDACYSGSATRAAPGEPAVRGVAKPIILRSSGGGPKTGGSDNGAGVDAEAITRGGSAEAGPLIVISAARHDQVDNETYDPNGNPVGPLSLAVSMVLPRLSRWATYRTLHDRIASAMAGMNLYDQRPQIEGIVDARVFSGSIVQQTPFYRIDYVIGDTIARVKGGRLLGLIPGTKIDFHPSGTSDPAKSTSIAKGVVVLADASNAVVRVRGASSNLRSSWAFVTDYAFDGMQTRVRLDATLTPGAKELASRALSGLKVVVITSDKANLVVRDPSGRGTGLEVVTSSGQKIGPMINASSTDSERELRDRVLSYARSGILRSLELKDPLYDVRMELVRTQPRIIDSGGEKACSAGRPVPLAESSRTADGIVLRPGDEYTLQLVNEGVRPAYITILDLTPDGRISQLFPLAGNLGSDNYLAPGASYTIPDICFYAEPPAGIEVLKLFATRDRLDFSPILSGTGTRGDLSSPLAQLFSDIYTGERSAPVAASGSGSTASLSITIVDKPRQ